MDSVKSGCCLDVWKFNRPSIVDAQNLTMNSGRLLPGPVRMRIINLLIIFGFGMISSNIFSIQMHMPGLGLNTDANKYRQSGNGLGYGITYAYLFSLWVVDTREVGKFPAFNVGPRIDLMTNEAKIGIDLHFFGAALLGGGVVNFLTKEYGNNSPYIYVFQPYLLVLGLIYIEWRYEIKDQGLKFTDQVTLNFRFPIYRPGPDTKSMPAK